MAIFGIIVNGFTAYKLSSGTSINEKVFYWHLLEDVLGWVAVPCTQQQQDITESLLTSDPCRFNTPCLYPYISALSPL